jgi:hypothetical protein
MRYGAFHLNLAAAGLEDNIIAELAPEWNFNAIRLPEGVTGVWEISGKALRAPYEPLAETQEEAPSGGAAPAAVETFEFQLQPTYWTRGFFNGGVASSALLGADGDTIEIFFGDEDDPILGTINRSANANSSPRVLGGPALRNRFQTLPEMSVMVVEVRSPSSIHIRAKSTQ